MILFAGKITDPHGSPAAAATVWVTVYERSSSSGIPQPSVFQCRSGPDGSFRLEAPGDAERWWASVVAVRAGDGPGGQYISSPADAADLELALTRPDFVAGCVVDPAGRPIAGAVVRAESAVFPNHETAPLPPEPVSPTAVTDAAGRFHLAPLPAHSRVSLSVEHPEYARWASGHPIRSGTSDERITLLLGGSIAGQVLGEAGAPAAGVRVRCHGGSVRPPLAVSDAEGVVRFDGLPPGSYLLFVEGRDIPADLAAEPQVCVLPEGEAARCPPLRLERLPVGWAVGQVREEATGAPIAGAGVTGVWQFKAPGILGAPVSGPVVFTDAEGRYRLPLRPGSWLVRMAEFPPGYLPTDPWNQGMQVRVAEGQTAAADFTLCRAVRLRGRVLDATGRPAARARLRCQAFERGRTDADGRFDLGPRFAPGEPVLVHCCSRDRSQGAMVELAPDRIEAEQEVHLEPLSTVTGRVTDAAGAPVADAWVGVDRQVSVGGGRRGFREESLAAAISDAEGRFALSFLPDLPGRVWVEADGFDRAEQFPVELRRGQPDAPLAFVLQRAEGFVAGGVVDPEGRPLAGVRVSARTMQASRVLMPAGEATTDGEGRFRIVPLPSGEVRLQAQRSGYYPELRSRVVVGSGSVRLMLAPLEALAASPPAVGDPAPEIAVTHWIHGPGFRSLSERRGQWVVLQFSAAYNRAASESNHGLRALQTMADTAGPPAARVPGEAGAEISIYALYAGAVSDAEVEAYLRSEGLSFPVGLVEGGVESPTFRAYGVRRLPALFVIDGDGIIRAVDPDPEALLRLLEPASSRGREG